jgi:multidrug efflux pump subunit AcrA (membrane-fusion protein)
LLTLYDPRSLRLEVPVQESLAVGLQPGDELSVTIDAADRPMTGSVDEIVPRADATSRSCLVKLRLPHSDGLYEGMFGRVQILSGSHTRVCVPHKAVRTVGQLQFVQVLDAAGRRAQRFVRTGRVCPDDQIEILSGIDAGERVVLQEDGR